MSDDNRPKTPEEAAYPRIAARSPEAEWLARLSHQFAEYKVPEGGVVNVPENCVVVLRATVEKLLDLAGRSSLRAPTEPTDEQIETALTVMYADWDPPAKWPDDWLPSGQVLGRRHMKAALRAVLAGRTSGTESPT